MARGLVGDREGDGVITFETNRIAQRTYSPKAA